MNNELLKQNAIEFQDEIQKLMDKFNVVYDCDDQYDGEDKYCGKDYFFRIHNDEGYFDFQIDDKL